jgi:hypothetical protein
MRDTAIDNATAHGNIAEGTQVSVDGSIRPELQYRSRETRSVCSRDITPDSHVVSQVNLTTTTDTAIHGDGIGRVNPAVTADGAADYLGR